VAAPEWTVERHLEAGCEQGRDLWRRSAELVNTCDEHSLSVAKTTVALKGTKRGFAGAWPKDDELVGYFDVSYQVEDPRLRRVPPYEKDLFVHHFRTSSLDDAFSGWIRDAYEQVGCGRQ
jgi:hypothetical protein